MPREKGRPQKLIVDERMYHALEMKRDGHSLSEICREVGYSSVPTLCKALNAAIKQHWCDADEVTEDIRRLECARLDAQLKALWPAAMEGDVRANDCLLRLSARRASLLGLDAPKTTEITGKDGGPIQLSPVIMLPPESVD